MLFLPSCLEQFIPPYLKELHRVLCGLLIELCLISSVCSGLETIWSSIRVKLLFLEFRMRALHFQCVYVLFYFL